MSNITSHIHTPPPLTTLFALCKQVSPYLSGELTKVDAPSDEDWLDGSAQDSHSIQALYHSIQQEAPQAGHQYWLTRSWDLLCWQPMYIACIAIYGMQQSPDFSAFKQHYHHHSIFEFEFLAHAPIDGTEAALIAHSGKQLNALFTHYSQHCQALFNVRANYLKRLQSDLVLSCLIKVRDHLDHFDDNAVQQHARLWMQALGLSGNLNKQLIVHDAAPLKHIRKSCCLTYKANNALCDNCPKHSKPVSIHQQEV